MTRTELHDCFLSYSTQDRDAALRLHTALTARGVSCFQDVAIEGGELWFQKIDDALQSARHCILLLSSHSLRSRWVQLEWRAFVSDQVQRDESPRLIVLRLDDVAVRGLLGSFQEIDLRAPERLEDAVKDLVSVVQGTAAADTRAGPDEMELDAHAKLHRVILETLGDTFERKAFRTALESALELTRGSIVPERGKEFVAAVVFAAAEREGDDYLAGVGALFDAVQGE